MSYSRPQLPPFMHIIRNATPGPLPTHENAQVVPPLLRTIVQDQTQDSVAGYLVSVIQHTTQPAMAPARGRAPAPKKTQVVKSDRIQLEKLSRYELAQACLSLHNLEDDYRAHKVLGFPFKMWWTGCSGGKATAATVETDTEYDLLLAQLRASKKNAKDITVFVSFDTDELDAFRRLRKRPAPSDLTEHVGTVGTKVPCLSDMDAPIQLHGSIITLLKATHPCEKHRGEHGKAGFCYVMPIGTHVGLNNHWFAIWAAAIAAGDATCHIPPNVPEFDGPEGIGPLTTKPCGWGGSAQTPALTLATPMTPDPTAILMAAMVPLLVSLTQSVAPCPTTPGAVVEPKARKDVTESMEHLDATDTNEPGVATRFTFLPSHTFNCALAFKADTGIDIVGKVGALDHRDLTLDILPEVPHEHLAGVLGVSEGKTIRFQLYCCQWAREFACKKKEKEII